jgi:hypothetical protein
MAKGANDADATENEIQNYNSGDVEGMETFDNFEHGDYTESREDVERLAKKSGVDIGKSKKESEDDEENQNTDKDSQTNHLEDEEDDGTKKEDDKEEKDKKSEDKEKEEDDKKQEDKDSKKGKDKGVKVKTDDGVQEVPKDAKVRVKVNGKFEERTIQEVMDDFSGREGYDRKFSELSEKFKEKEQTIQEYEQEKQELTQHLEEIGNRIRGGLQGQNNPLDAFKYLLDISGADPVEYEKKLFEALTPEIQNFQDMSEQEQEAYWAKKENEVLKRRLESSSQDSGQVRSNQDSETQAKELREAQGVSEQDYNSAAQELENLGEQDLSPERVVNYAKAKPAVDRAEGLVGDYADTIGSEEKVDQAVRNIAELILSDPEIDDSDIVDVLEEHFGGYQEINDKYRQQSSESQSKGKSAPEPKDGDEPESFDDFDEIIAFDEGI